MTDDAQAAAVRGVDEPPVDQSGDQTKGPLPAKPLPAPAPQTIAQKVQLAEDFTADTHLEQDRVLQDRLEDGNETRLAVEKERLQLLGQATAAKFAAVAGTEADRARRGKLYGRAKTRNEGERYDIMDTYLRVVSIGRIINGCPIAISQESTLLQAVDDLQNYKEEAVASNTQLDLHASVSITCSDFIGEANSKLEGIERLKARERTGIDVQSLGLGVQKPKSAPKESRGVGIAR